MKIAYVYDRINKLGGAERVLSELHSLYPEAPLYTAFYDRKKVGEWIDGWEVKSSFLSRIPGVAGHHELFPWAAPMAFESFSFDGYDAVVSVTSAEAKSVITKPDTCHICYCLTPTRYLWSGVKEYEESPRIGAFGPLVKAAYRKLLPKLRDWDLIASTRPDSYVAISRVVAERIGTYYGKRNVPVIYPPVATDVFTPGAGKPEDFYLTVARLVPYKRVDIVAAACARLGRKLVVVGRGYDEKRVVEAGRGCVEIVRSELTDTKLREYYRSCRAFLYAGIEDFGIAVAEAQSCGKPVVALGMGGAGEIVKDGVTGVLFRQQDPGSMADAIEKFESRSFSAEACRGNALGFSADSFRKKMREFIVQTVRRYKETHS